MIAAVAARHVERFVGVEIEFVGNRAFGLLNDDPAVERILELLAQQVRFGCGAVVQDPDGGDIGEGLGGSDVVVGEGTRLDPQQVERSDRLVTQAHREGERGTVPGGEVIMITGHARSAANAAIESAGVVLASSDPRSVLGVIGLSKAGYRKMVQSLAWGAGYNLAAGVFAFAVVTLSPAVGAVLMNASTVVVAVDAQLLRRVQLRPDEGT